MEKTLNRSQLEAQLEGKKDSISRRLEALQTEVGGLSVRRIVDDKPWIAVAAAVAGGLLLGLLFGGGKSKRKSSGLHAALVEGYVASVGEDVRELTGKGKEVTQAVAEALRDRVPLIVYKGDDDHTTKGMIRQGADLIFKAAAGFAAKSAIDYATSMVDLQKLVVEAETSPEGTAITDPPLESPA